MVGLLALAPSSAAAVERLPKQLEGVTVREHLGQQLDLAARFRDHEDNAVQLSRYFADGKPVLLTLNYYRCRTLCSLQLNALMRGLRELGWKPGEQYRVVTISIDPREQPKLAREKRSSYLHALEMGDDIDWSFLVGDKQQIDKIANAVGFEYRFLPKENQYAHPAVIFFASPTGRISRYLYGISYPGQQIKFALVDASEGRVGSTVDRIILSCFHYDATVGAYGPFAFGIMRLGGALTLIVLGGVLLHFWRRERQLARRQAQAGASTG